MGAGAGRIREAGFTLMGAAVLVALVLIAALAAAPFLVRQANRQRQIQTQEHLRKAFYLLFQNKKLKPASLFADFGFRPNAPTGRVNPADNNYAWDLRCLTDITAVTAMTGQTPQPYGGDNTPGWNGPYWTGPLDAQGRPMDAWGKPLELRWISTGTPGWQLFSTGGNGICETGNNAVPGGDDQVFPEKPYQQPPPGGCTRMKILQPEWAVDGPVVFFPDEIQLTSDTSDQRGTLIYTRKINAQDMTLEFEFFSGGTYVPPNGKTPPGEGIAVVFLDERRGMRTDWKTTGKVSSWMGTQGMKGFFLAFANTEHTKQDPKLNYHKNGRDTFLAFSDGTEETEKGVPTGHPHWITANLNGGFKDHWRDAYHTMKIVSANGKVLVYKDGSSTECLNEPLTLPSSAYIGFMSTTGSGGTTDFHRIRNVWICAQ